ncbi:hypothetical protein P3S67_021258 [Capsicum chacoense]
MSNSDLFQVKEEDDKKIISSDDIQLATSNNPDRCIDIAPDQHDSVDAKQDENNPGDDDGDDNIKKKEIFREENCSEDQDDKGRSCPGQSDIIGMIQRRSIQVELLEDDTQKSRNNSSDDGFTTPTSSDHKIPVMTTCPPAPKKGIKRRFSVSPNIHPTLQVDVESIIQEEDLGGNNKKLRKNDHQE